MPTGGCRSQIAIEKKNGPTAVDKPGGMYNNTPLVIYSLEGNPIDKSRRQAALLRLIRSQPVENQEQIVALMLREGFRVTQASVSRDIREMGLVKLAGRYLSAERALGRTARRRTSGVGGRADHRPGTRRGEPGGGQDPRGRGEFRGGGAGPRVGPDHGRDNRRGRHRICGCSQPLGSGAGGGTVERLAAAGARRQIRRWPEHCSRNALRALRDE